MEPGGVKIAGMPSRAADDGGSELARTTSVVFFIKLELWRMEAWS